MQIQEALKNIMENNLDSMRENIQAALSEKAAEKLEEMKQNIATSYFERK